MTDILNDPTIQSAVNRQRTMAKLGSAIADHVISTSIWGDLDQTMRKVCIRHIVSQAENEPDLYDGLSSLGVGSDVDVSWLLYGSNDETADEMRILVEALGGLISKNGALVMIRVGDEFF